MDKSIKSALGAIALVLGLGACQNNTEKITESADLKGFPLSSLDTTVQPCSNFFNYATGGWAKNNPIPETESRWGNFGILQESNQMKLRGLLDSLAQVLSFTADDQYAQLLNAHYQAGLDSTAINNLGVAPLNDYRARLQNVKTYGQYLKFLSWNASMGFTAPFRVSVGVDDKNSAAYLLNISQSGLGLPDRDYYLKDDEASKKIQEQYRSHVANMLQLIEIQEYEANKAAQAIYDFEKSLAQNMMSRVDRREPENTYHKIGRAQLEEFTPSLDLEGFFAELNLQFDSLNVSQLDYLKNLGSLLQKTDIKVLKQYHLWHQLSSTADYLPAAFENESFNFYSTVLRGTNEMKPRWRRVMSGLGSGLSEPLGRLFANRYFPAEAKTAVEQMVEDLRTAYRQRITKLTWMGDSTKEKALEKLAAFNYKIGYPDVWKDLSGLTLNPDEYYQNHMTLRAYGVKENFEKLGQPVDKDEWFMPAYLVNAYYSSSYNEIVFPAGILQAPFYDVEADAALNYGGIGGVIGHEFSHGFDDQGSKYDASGNLNLWWTNDDRTNFEARTGLMVEQFNDYEPLPNLHVNGQLTLGENIADLGGLTMAYYAYEVRLERMKAEAQVKSGFTWQQRVFLGWAQVWQTVQKDEYTKNQVMTDAHSPAEYRVNGPVSNMPEFWEAWSCSPGDSLVRADSLQVEIW